MESKKEIKEPLPNDGVVGVDYENEQNTPNSSRIQLVKKFFKKINATIKNIVHKKGKESEDKDLNAQVKELLSDASESILGEQLKKIQDLCGSEEKVGLLQQPGLNDELKAKAEEFIKKSSQTFISLDYKTAILMPALQRTPEILNQVIKDIIDGKSGYRSEDKSEERKFNKLKIICNSGIFHKSSSEKNEFFQENFMKQAKKTLEDPNTSIDTVHLLLQSDSVNPLSNTNIAYNNIKSFITPELRRDKNIIGKVIDNLSIEKEGETQEEKLKKIDLLCGNYLGSKNGLLKQTDIIEQDLINKGVDIAVKQAVSLVEDPYLVTQSRDSIKTFITSVQMVPDVLEKVSEKIVTKEDLSVKQKAEQLKFFYKDSYQMSSQDTENIAQIGLEYTKKLLNSTDEKLTLASSFLFPSQEFQESSVASEFYKKIRNDEEIINGVVECALEQKVTKEKVNEIQEEINKIKEEIDTMDDNTDEKKKKEEEIKEKEQEKAIVEEQGQVEKVWLLLGSTYSDKGLLQEEKLKPDLKERATTDIQNTIANTSSYAVLIAAENSGIPRDPSIEETIQKGQARVAEKMLNETIEIKDRNDFHAMLDIARKKGAQNITHTEEFAEKFAECVSKRYEYLEEQINTSIGEKQQQAYFEEDYFFHDMAYTLKKNSDLAKDSKVRGAMLNCIENELEKTKNLKIVYNDEKISNIFNKLFEANDANKDEKLVNLATNFFDKEVNSQFSRIEDETFIKLCSNENFTQNEKLKKLAVDGLVKSLDGEDFGERILSILKTDKARDQFVQTINSADETSKKFILSNLNDSIDDLESEKEQEQIKKLISDLSKGTTSESIKLEEEEEKKEEKKEEKPELSLNGENKPNSLESLNNISSVSDSTQQSIAGSAGRNNNNDRSL